MFVIDSIEKLKECENYFKNIRLSSSNLLPVGFAAEWVISLFDVRKKELALIQLAVNDCVYLIDCVFFQQTRMKPLKKLMGYIFQTGFFVVAGYYFGQNVNAFAKHLKKRSWIINTNYVDFFKLRNDKLFLEVCRKHYKLNCKNRNQKRLSWISGLCHQVKELFFIEYKYFCCYST